MAGSIGGMLIATVTGFVLQFTGSYLVLFAIIGSLYLVALLVYQMLVPRIESLNVSTLSPQL